MQQQQLAQSGDAQKQVHASEIDQEQIKAQAEQIYEEEQQKQLKQGLKDKQVGQGQSEMVELQASQMNMSSALNKKLTNMNKHQKKTAVKEHKSFYKKYKEASFTRKDNE